MRFGGFASASASVSTSISASPPLFGTGIGIVSRFPRLVLAAFADEQSDDCSIEQPRPGELVPRESLGPQALLFFRAKISESRPSLTTSSYPGGAS